MFCRFSKLLIPWLAAAGILGATLPAFAELKARPTAVYLDRPEASVQLVITQRRNERDLDVTRDVRFEDTLPSTFWVSSSGVVSPVSEGASALLVRLGDEQLSIP